MELHLRFSCAALKLRSTFSLYRAGIHRADLAARLPLSYNLLFLPLFANNIIQFERNSLSASLSLEGTYSMNH